jgi:choline dehydrogenase-like flavoprotein
MLTSPQNHHIGRNLYLHPVNIVSAHWPEDIRPWEGGILTSVVGTFENQDGHGHGSKLETTCMMPSWCLTFMNWTSGLDFKLQALKYRHMNSFISITRDRDTGRVYPDPETGCPRIQYTPSAFDRAHTMEGVLALARIAFTMGASDIHVAIANTPAFVRASTPLAPESEAQTSARFEDWLSSVKQAGNQPPAAIFASAHQMGTCRMAKAPHLGVVDPSGKVWGTEGLYVSDASVFPSASGVNPMITNMAISDWISRELSETMHREKRAGGNMARL